MNDIVKICRVGGCKSSRAGRSSLCQVHKYRWQKYRSFDEPVKEKYKTPLDGSKNCHLCKDSLPLTGFSKSEIEVKWGRCRKCVYEISRSSRKKKSLEEWRAYNCEYDKNNLIKSKQKRRKHVLKKYGISEQDYFDLNEKQGGKCKICNQVGNGYDKKWKVSRKLAVDHCHKTGRVRGLLCTRCNNALGAMKDDIILLNIAIEYLKAHQ